MSSGTIDAMIYVPEMIMGKLGQIRLKLIKLIVLDKVNKTS